MSLFDEIHKALWAQCEKDVVIQQLEFSPPMLDRFKLDPITAMLHQPSEGPMMIFGMQIHQNQNLADDEIVMVCGQHRVSLRVAP